MNSENSKTSDPHRLLLIVNGQIDLRRKDKCIALSYLSIYYTWKNIKTTYKNNKFKISAPTYSVSDIQDYSECILEKSRGKTVYPAITTYINKIENRIVFKIKTGYFLEILKPETLKLPASTKSKITNNENGEMFFMQKLLE